MASPDADEQTPRSGRPDRLRTSPLHVRAGELERMSVISEGRPVLKITLPQHIPRYYGNARRPGKPENDLHLDPARARDVARSLGVAITLHDAATAPHKDRVAEASYHRAPQQRTALRRPVVAVIARA